MALKPTIHNITTRYNRTPNTLTGKSLNEMAFTRLTGSLQDGYIQGIITDANATSGAQRVELSVPCIAGEKFQFHAEIATNTSAQMALAIQFFDNNTPLLSRETYDAQAASTTFTQLSTPEIIAPAGSTRASVWLYLGNGAKAIGQYIRVRRGTTAPLPYFDGSTLNDDNYTYHWLGAPYTGGSSALPALYGEPPIALNNSIEIRRNLAITPYPNGATGFLSNNAGTYPRSLDTTIVRRPGTVSARFDRSAVSPSNAICSSHSVGHISFGPTTDISPVIEGEEYTFSVYHRCNVDNPRLLMQMTWFNDAGVSLGATNSPYLDAGAPNMWNRSYWTATAPVGATHLRTGVGLFHNNNGNTDGTEQTWLQDALVVRGPEIPAYFDGNFDNTGERTYEWVGTPFASPSIEMGRVVDQPVDITSGWTVQEYATPLTIGKTAGGSGSVSFTTETEPESMWLLNKPVRSEEENLGVIRGYAKNVNIGALGTGIGHDNVLAKYDADRKFPPLAAGSMWAAADLADQLYGAPRLKLRQ